LWPFSPAGEKVPEGRMRVPLATGVALSFLCIRAERSCDDVAILAYKVHEELTVDGKPVKLDAADASAAIAAGVTHRARGQLGFN